MAGPSRDLTGSGPTRGPGLCAAQRLQTLHGAVHGGPVRSIALRPSVARPCELQGQLARGGRTRGQPPLAEVAWAASPLLKSAAKRLHPAAWLQQCCDLPCLERLGWRSSPAARTQRAAAQRGSWSQPAALTPWDLGQQSRSMAGLAAQVVSRACSALRRMRASSMQHQRERNRVRRARARGLSR